MGASIESGGGGGGGGGGASMSPVLGPCLGLRSVLVWGLGFGVWGLGFGV